MERYHLTFQDVVFIDDDPNNIKNCNLAKTCLTVLINERNGMDEKAMQSIEKHFVTKRREFDKLIDSSGNNKTAEQGSKQPSQNPTPNKAEGTDINNKPRKETANNANVGTGVKKGTTSVQPGPGDTSTKNTATENMTVDKKE
eukprot:UN30991